jgi:nucleotide-binding universal stress UspA family protein
VSTPSAGLPSDSGRIVVGVDGSTSSTEALRWALGQARLTGQPVDAVISWDYPVYSGLAAIDPVEAIDWAGDRTNILQTTVKDVLGDADAPQVTQRVVRGHPAQVLVDAAADAALLVVGSRGHGGFTGMLLGSVSQHVVAHASCPVVVVHAPGTAPAPER